VCVRSRAFLAIGLAVVLLVIAAGCSSSHHNATAPSTSTTTIAPANYPPTVAKASACRPAVVNGMRSAVSVYLQVVGLGDTPRRDQIGPGVPVSGTVTALGTRASCTIAIDGSRSNLGLAPDTYSFVGRSLSFHYGKKDCRRSVSFHLTAVPEVSQALEPNIFVVCAAGSQQP